MSKKNLYDTVIKNGFDVASGALAVADKNIVMKLNEFGEYESIASNGDNTVFNNPKLSLISTMADESPDETEVSKKLYSNIPNIRHQKNIGYYLDLIAGYVVEGDYRKNASSGGFGTWIIKELFERKLIDGVIHVKEAHDGDGILFKYAVSKTLDEIKQGAKSKYYPAEFSEAINQIKKTKGKYAILGIPSVIMELRLLALQDKVVADRIAFTIGLICGHQKSAKYAECLAWECGIKPGNLEYIDFRVKAEGRSASDYDTKMIGNIDGSKRTIMRRTGDLFATSWGHGMFKVKFSDYTDDTFNETADISLGDAWLPRYVSDWQGTNIAIIRDTVIQKIFDEGLSKGLISSEIISENDVIDSQKGLVHHTRDELAYRLELLKLNNKWSPKKRYNDLKINIFKKNVQKTRLMFYENSRLYYGAAIRSSDWSVFVNRMAPIVKRYNIIYLIMNVKKITPKKIWKKFGFKILART